MCLAVPGLLKSISGAELQVSGLVDFSGVEREVSLAFVPEAVPGNYVLVHAGIAISVIDEAEAQRTLELLHALGESDEIPG